ncbi:ribosomal protein S18-alanine N-acetyltransferase [Agromyces atrinae]|uniref:ribosomal protein S18-alanine N-acetyltransferase n=1 Tax=Agromyces atrinae TaxID=592376 RepID=UPI001F59A2E6|nr:ribosomal protein S18-alanine N-acetyltransferase [Agromyces atrinae]MCI2957855.1 ribosomal protein S18-alanine N-acetyltransferase [Agromyces atrinae]
MTWQLRRAHVEDVDAIMALETPTFGTDAWSRESMQAELAHHDTYYLVALPVGADADAGIAAYAGVFAARGALQGDIQTIAVAPESRGGGLGRVLIQSLIAEAWKRGIREVFLEVRADNPVAQRLYHREGFEEIAVRRAYYQPDGVDALVMRLQLTAPVAAPAEVLS